VQVRIYHGKIFLSGNYTIGWVIRLKRSLRRNYIPDKTQRMDQRLTYTSDVSEINMLNYQKEFDYTCSTRIRQLDSFVSVRLMSLIVLQLLITLIVCATYKFLKHGFIS
jgi:nitric oxide reductase large subunit